jgi:DNA-binding FadR family transcriptional regulator
MTIETAEKTTESRDEDQSVKVMTQIISFIQKRGYSPGERLPSERDLAERFAVGRGLIREALTTLETVRYIERRPNSGVFLHRLPSEMSLEALSLYSSLGLPLAPQDMAESLEVRRILEVKAVKMACDRRTQEDIDSLRAVLAASQKAIDEGRSIATLDYEFHLAIFKATRNNILVRIVRPFYTILMDPRKAFFKNPENCRISHSHHVKIVDAIVDRDVDRATRMMEEHIGRVERYYLERPDAMLDDDA